MGPQISRTLGRNLRGFRKAEDLSQEAFAEVLGVHRTYMGALEWGERNVSLRSVEKIAGMLKIEPLLLLSEPGRSG